MTDSFVLGISPTVNLRTDYDAPTQTHTLKVQDAGIPAAAVPVPLPVTISAAASGGSSAFRSLTQTNVAVAVKASGGSVFSIHVGNAAAGAVKLFLHFYDVAQGSVTVGTTTPTRSFEILASGSFDKDPPAPLNFATAITIAITTTAAGGTAAAVLPELVELEFI